MAKPRTRFVCTQCGADYPRWQGQCGACGEWNTVTEFRESRVPASRPSGPASGYAGERSEVRTLAEVDVSDVPRISTGMGELDRVLGGGIVPGSVVLLGGHPGAGKSTLLLMTLAGLAQRYPVLYVTGEESLQQVALRARRLGLPVDALKVMSETDVERILVTAQAEQPRILVIDSIQVMFNPAIQSAPGSVSQVREAAAALTRFAKQTGTALLIVGHVTKDGSLAGPKVLEHIIDALLMLEGGADSRYRTLRAQKNRFGAVNELGVFAMMDSGLKEVRNPSAIFLNRDENPAPGSVVTVLWEGTRPLLVEIQALVDQAIGSAPRRLAVGQDPQRLAMLLAVMHRHGGLHCGDQDVYLNVVGGVKVTETSADLAGLLAVASSFKSRVVPRDWVVFGEVGLSGEVRPVQNGQERVLEAAKHGFRHAIIPKGNRVRQLPEGVRVTPVERLSEALELI
ncbi:DNA repair protein RadA [Hahella sp. SMD15-11]|uniref:DNA repair protein RadA n=1 Tax=Thermohahella caldifontis TaxID=3142973 RepID=A0AB39V161_9GAMM